jgi:SAM-dependent methyltransferase
MARHSLHPLEQTFLRAVQQAALGNTLVRVSLSQPTGVVADLKSVDVRPIVVKREAKLSFTYHYATKDIVKNFAPAESVTVLHDLLGKAFGAGKLLSLEGDVILSRKGREPVLSRHPASHTALPDLGHDRAKQRVLAGGKMAYLHALGVTNAQGQVVRDKGDKLVQIHKFVELFANLVKGVVEALPPEGTLKVVDMGAGKGYLTFAVFDYLANTLGISAEVVGVEARPELVAAGNALAAECGFAGLRFMPGTIADFDCTGAHVVMALHACDTATDDALLKAVAAKAGLVMVAPCCHKQVRPQLRVAGDHPMHPLLTYGTHAEQLAAMLTDNIRAMALRTQGYAPNLFEFVSDAHTPKNVMLVATRLADVPEAVLTGHLAALRGALRGWGIQAQTLVDGLGLG